MIIGLATPRPAQSLGDGIDRVERLTREAAAQRADIVCFPEAYLPGLRGQDFEVLAYDRETETSVVDAVAGIARAHGVAIIMGMEYVADHGRQIAAVVFNEDGRLLGSQLKTQLDPSEDRFYVPGDSRQMFEVRGVKFGIAICHEGWRYPETVRWAARRGASIVFHPQLTGTQTGSLRLTTWGAPDNPYYEKAMMMRSIENAIYFASVNYALNSQEAATTLIDPAGTCQAYLPYGIEGVLIQEIDPAKATGQLAARYAPSRYPDTP
jgi:predicted amidohydrolase